MKDRKVKDVMKTDVIFAEAPGKKADAIRLLCQHELSGLPVVKKDTRELVGIVTRQNIFDHPHESQLAMIMTRDPVTAHPDTPVKEAVGIMIDRRVRRLPVEKGGALVGILTCADLLRIMADLELDETVEGYLRGPCVPVFEGTPLRVVAATFDLARVYALPVVNAQARLVGIVTDQDLFSLTSIDTRTVMSTMGLGDDEDAWNYEGMRNLMRLYYEISETELPNVPVRKVMVKDPVTVYRKTSVSKAARTMVTRHFRQMPVRDSSDRLRAMLYDTDLLTVLAR
ncbi:MAG: CBS domain-containing protein [Euryarchaeota archaeon]|nr:CBS domain-containing protein [Euryarchaeota archaeon]